MPVTLTHRRRSGRPTLFTPVLKHSLAIFLGIVCLGLLIGLPIYSQYERNLRTDSAQAAAQRVALMQQTTHAEFNKLISDIKALAALPTLRSLISSDQLTPQHPLSHYLANVLLNDRRYDQIRILNRHGHELLRIVHRENRTFFIADSELRHRAGSDFVDETLRLLPGQIYVSPMQRNFGLDRIENPNIPIIRLGTQLQDSHGKVQGLMVLDYRAEGLLNSFNAIMSGTDYERTFMFGRQGNWLYTQHTDSHDGQYDPLSATHADSQLTKAWPRMANLDKGQVHTSEGFYVIESVYPLMFDPGSIPNAHLSQELGVPPSLVEQYRWQIVTYIPNEAWRAKSVLRQPWGLITLAVITTLLALIIYETVTAWSYKSTLRKERERTAKELENLYEDAPCGYHTLGPDGQVLRMNRTELSWLGYRKEEVVGVLNYVTLLAPESRDAFTTRFNEFIKGGVINDFRVSMLRRDGRTFPVTIHASAVRSPDGSLIETRATILDVTERHRLEQELRRQAYTDPLTGLYNRRHFFELGERQLRQSARGKSDLSVCMMDIDNFKAVNDTYGHEAGDRVLVTLSRRTAELLRPTDLLARLGGEEFALLLPHTARDEAKIVANRLREALAQERIGLSGGQDISVTVSIGVAANETPGETLEALLQRADKQLYAAKTEGRNRVC